MSWRYWWCYDNWPCLYVLMSLIKITKVWTIRKKKDYENEEIIQNYKKQKW